VKEAREQESFLAVDGKRRCEEAALQAADARRVAVSFKEKRFDRKPVRSIYDFTGSAGGGEEHPKRSCWTSMGLMIGRELEVVGTSYAF